MSFLLYQSTDGWPFLSFRFCQSFTLDAGSRLVSSESWSALFDLAWGFALVLGSRSRLSFVVSLLVEVIPGELYILFTY